MEWRYEIYRAVFVAFGAMELILNLGYLIKSDGMLHARRQHQEIPKEVSDVQMKRKVVMMLIFGGLFLVAGLSSYLLHTMNYAVSLTVLICFFVYALSEAIYYRYRNTFGFAGVSLLLLLLFVI